MYKRKEIIKRPVRTTIENISLKTKININIRRLDSKAIITNRNNRFFTTTFPFTFLYTSLLLCILIIVGMTSAQGLSQLPSFQPGNFGIRHRVQRYADPSPQDGVGDFNHLHGDILPQTAEVGNLHKPNFTTCALYQPELSEEQPSDTFVVQVKAIDRDPYDIGGKISYSIIDANDSFVIDPDNGIVRTRKKFDRDEPAKEKEIYVTVKARDNGRPQLEAVCTIKVKILDINDNKPTFDRYNYKETVAQDLEVNKVVARVSASDIDDGNNGTVLYKLDLHPSQPGDIKYFDIIPQTGEVLLKETLVDMINKPEYLLKVIATDRGRPPQSDITDLKILVVESNRKAPSIENHQRHFVLPETTVDKTKPILTLTANSNTPDGKVFFQLLNGPTESSNKDNHFTLESTGNTAFLKIDKDLDYESVTKYTLTIRATNKYNLATETLVTVEITDENDEKPDIIENSAGSILENEPPQTYVMKIRAVDKDGTSPNNKVKYYLREEDKVNFRIDEETGEIWSMKEFDREETEIYQIYVILKDGAPGVKSLDGSPNERIRDFKIEIKDKNDNKPVFIKIPPASVEENANLKSKVIEVRAEDKDKDSIITYSIVAGDPDNYFGIEGTSTSGIIYVKKPLDYETIQKYELRVKASDSVFEAFTTVIINVENVNDNPPQFITSNTHTTIVEESIPAGCIFQVQAYDPDILDRNQPQNIVYFLDKGMEDFHISFDGCVTVIKKLDRDPPNGYASPQVIVGAWDEGGTTSTKKSKFLDLTITLSDINDNAPFLNSTNPVVWYENQPAGVITHLTADDFDEPRNGPPFNFYIDPSADREIKNLFTVSGHELSTVKANFDRETRKEYLVPIVITDGGTPQQTGTSMLTVIIGDENDNRMKSGESKIFMYKYKDTTPVTLGRVYVDDPDDWDLPDKTFFWRKPHPDFKLDRENGNIDALPSVTAGTYRLEFRVEDSKWGDIVDANVDVVVKQITDEAVDNSGSIRLYGITQEDFIKRGSDGKSKQDILRTEIARIFGIENEDNVDVFTVLNSPHNQPQDPLILDVRYSAHNSPYYKAEKLDGKLGENKAELEKLLGVKIMMVRIDECLQERYICESGCTNVLHKSDTSYKIYTNTTSFVGVNAYVDRVCICAATLAPTSCDSNPCLSGGICQRVQGIDGFRCECPVGSKGKRCEVSSIHLDGETSAWYPPFSVCSDSILDIHFKTKISDSLIMYNGPTFVPSDNVTDFVSLELRDGRPMLLMDYGSGVRELKLASQDLADDSDHFISIKWTKTEISISVDGCPGKDPSCFTFGGPVGSHVYLNVNGPLQLGGLSFDIKQLKSAMSWSTVPTMNKFAGCITNLSLNGQFYNLREPSFATGNVTTCESPEAGGVIGGPWLTAGLPFIIIIIVCLLILIILILSVLFYRRRRVYEEIKSDPADDVRENIMNYDDDGGGEGDAKYNLALLGRPYPQSPTDRIPLERLYPVGRAVYHPDEPDMQSFVQGNKDKMDRDQDGLPFDDVRNYAYEGDGNSLGSLSSLATGTDDSDLNFDFLPSFGPRFKKLADMYGGNSSDDNSSTYSGT